MSEQRTEPTKTFELTPRTPDVFQIELLARKMDLRYGQAVWTLLGTFYDLRSLTGTEYDCYYDDSRVAPLYERLGL